jgi:hypothetical protein
LIAFLIGFLVSTAAGVPAILIARGGRETSMKRRLLLWGIGLLTRFAVIGAALIFLFTQTSLARVPLVIGVGVAYLISYSLETILSLRA